MDDTIISRAIRSVSDEFSVELADSSGMIEECHRIRYEVYCQERRFLPGQDGIEHDEYDGHSAHIALLSRRDGEVAGTVRLVLALHGSLEHSFPLQHVCAVGMPHDMPIHSTAEISRFAISKTRRGVHTAALMRIGLFRGIVRASAGLGITHWCAVMEPALLRLLETTSIRFQAIGPIVDYHGLRQPCYNTIDRVMDGIRRGRPPIWDYLTNNGEYWPPACLHAPAVMAG